MDEKALKLVKNYIIVHEKDFDNLPEFDTYIISKCKVLQNTRYLISTTLENNHCHYELMYDGERHMWHFHVYEKIGSELICE